MTRRTDPLAALLAAAALAVACGPSGPGSGGSTPGDGGGTSGGGTPGGGGGAGAPAAPGSGGDGGGTTAPTGRGQSAGTKKMGGLGVEWTHDVAFAPDGSVVAFNIIGVRGERLEQIGFVHLDGDGNEFQSEFEDEGNAALRLSPAGSFAILPSGNMVVAATGVCGGDRCPTIGGEAVDGGALVVLDGRARRVWSRRLPGEVLSNVAVDDAGDLLVAARSPGGAALRKYGSDGALAWEQDALALSPGTPVALDDGGNAYRASASGDTLVKLDASGNAGWQQKLGGGAGLQAIQGAGDGVIVVGRFGGTVELAGSSLTPPAGADHGWFLAWIAGDGTPRWAVRIDGVQEVSDAGVKARLAVDADGRSAVVMGADACTAAVYGFEPTGELRWRRSLASNGCGGRDVVVNGVAATRSRIAVGGALSGGGAVDFGTGPVSPLATDGFVVTLEP